MRALFLFGRDLRLGDHAGLAAAARAGEIVAAVVLDPKAPAHDRKNPRRRAYHRAALTSLSRDLRERGAQLIVRSGPRVSTALKLAREARAETVVWSASYDALSAERDRELQSAFEEAGLRVQVVHDAPAVPPEETAAQRSAEAGRGYRALAPYVSAWLERPHEPIATHPHFVTHDIGGEDIDGGEAYADEASETAALTRLDAFVAGPITQYVASRNVPAAETSRLGAPLSFGLIAARTILARVAERERDAFLLAEERLALLAFRRALARRDFFLQLMWYFEDKPDAVLQERMRGFAFAKKHKALDAWREGRTGVPLVDAAMRELRATGYIHPRARAIAASFLCFDLGVDWRVGRDAWDAELIECEPALATGNWQWVCGVGADLAQFPRIYNPSRQGRALDPRGTYVRRWVPELAHVSDAELYGAVEPLGRSQLALPLYDDRAYPSPVVDHDAAARAFLTRYAAFTTPR